MDDLAKAYDPKEAEERQWSFWQQNQFFKADAHSKKPPYSMVIPPPNVTGVLHMGHALVNTLQDVLARWKRMCGFEVLWVPGTDHAGIATQTVVERHLMKTTGKRRKDFSREEFLSHVWAWKEESETQILGQLKKLGCSCDWSRQAFTMDEERSLAVQTMFKKMFDDGLIYRGDYLVNWDPVTQTALADDEVEYEDKSSFLWHIRYPFADGNGYLVVATTRPETLLGDTAVAISPDDIRYKAHLHRQIKIPLVNRVVAVIEDSHIDPLFGTGCVKVTPAHDMNDYDMALRHSLPFINILTPDGKINENGAPFTGLSVEEAREAVIKALKEQGLLEKIEPHTHRVGISYRSKAVIQPYLSKQWFVKLSAFKTVLIRAIQEKKVRLVPENFENTYFHWIQNLRDWCISRQLWWGHRIPIWYRKDNPEILLCHAGPGAPAEVAQEPANWVQDEDVLDTWFSSALWPFSVMGWPKETADFHKFYPTTTLVTGHDILFFWVARMMMMGNYAFGTFPFSTVFLHGLIYGKSYWRHNPDDSITYLSAAERDPYDKGAPVPATIHSKWEKMSKSKGNIIDPLQMIETFGTDALRMALCASATHARQIDLDQRRFEEFKNFANKIWNGARFVLMHLQDVKLEKDLTENQLALEDRWILSLLNRTIQDVNTALHTYSFDKAAFLAYNFFWKEFCAYYLELTKPVLFGKAGTVEEKETKQKVLFIVLCASIRLLHPMAPFITEELFQLLKKLCGEAGGVSNPYLQEALKALSAPSCTIAPYPSVINPLDMSVEIEEQFAFMDRLVHAVRTIRAEMQLSPGTATNLHIIGLPEDLKTVQAYCSILKALVRLESLHLEEKSPSFAFCSSATVDNLTLIIPLPVEMLEKEKSRLLKEKEKLIQQENGARNQLANPEFIAKAPPHLVEKLRTTLQQTEKELVSISSKLLNLS